MYRTPLDPIRALFALALVGCGPAVASDPGDDTGGSTAADATAPGTVTASWESGPGDAVTSIDPSDAEADVGPDSSEGDTTIGGSFIIDPDGGVCSCECDVWSQDCGRGSKCVPWSNDGGEAWNAARCSEIDPSPAAVGEPCIAVGSGTSGLDSCDAGAICWGVDPETLAGTCVAMCTGTEVQPSCDDGLACVVAFGGVVVVCLTPCDPLMPSCAAGEACMPTGQAEPSATFACMPVPPFVAGSYGDPCERWALERCDTGLACVADEHVPGCVDAECCTQLGVAAQAPVCPDVDQSCLPLDDADPDGLCFCGVAG